MTREELIAIVHEIGPRLAERAPIVDRDAVFPYESYADLRAAGLLGLCVPTRYGGLGADFATYMHVGAEIARYCANTALTFNMHSQTVLWTGVVADALTWTDAERAAIEERRARLYAGVLERGEIHAQPLSEGLSRGAGATITTVATPVDGGLEISGRKVFASLAGAAHGYSITCQVPGEERTRFVNVAASNPGVRIVDEWDVLGMRGTDSRTLVFDRAFVPDADELLPPGGYDQLAARFPHVFMSLTCSFIGLTRAVVDFARGYMASVPPPGVQARRDIPQKQAGWADLQTMYHSARVLWERAVAEAGPDPDPDTLARAWVAHRTVMDTAPEAASLALRICGGATIARRFPLERHYRDARCGALMQPWTVEVLQERLGRHGIFDDA